MNNMASPTGKFLAFTALALLSGVVAAQSRSDIVAIANCGLLGGGLSLDKYRLDESDIDRALHSPVTAEVSPAEIEQFRRYVTYPEGCLADELQVKTRLAGYVVSEWLNEVSRRTTKPIQPAELKNSRAERDCEQLDASTERENAKGAALAKLSDDLYGWLSQHPFLGNPEINEKSAEEAKWRAYHIGRKRFEEGKQPSVDGYVYAFARMRTSQNAIPEKVTSTPIFYFLYPTHFPEKTKPLFDVISASNQEPLDYASYVARRRVWNYVMTGNTNWSYDLEDAALKDISKYPDIDLARYLEGEMPGPAQCSLAWGAANQYEAIIKKTPEQIHGLIFQAVYEGLVKMHGGREQNTGTRSFRALATPHLFPKEAKECVGNLIKAQQVTETFDEHGTLVGTQVQASDVEPERNYDVVTTGPSWSSAYLAALKPDAKLSESQKQDILAGRVMGGRYKSYFDGVKLQLVDRCGTEQMGTFGMSMTAPKTIVLDSKMLAGRWREE